MRDCYDRAGAPISMERWGELFEDFEYKVVAKKSLALGDDRVEVSTVWLGLDHSFYDGRAGDFRDDGVRRPA